MAKQITASTLGTSPDTYLYTLARSDDEQVIATIASDDSLRIFNPTLNVLQTSKPCHNGVSCLKSGSRGFFTAGRDGLIKQWDLRGNQSAGHISEPQNRSFSALTVHGDHYVAAGTDSTKEGLGDVSVLIFDTRNPGKPLRNYSESHSDSITQLAFHPSQSNMLLSASTDGLVSFFDVDQADEDDALQRVLNPKSAVHCSGFLANDQSYVLTTDEVFSIYTLSDNADGSGDPTMEFGDMREKLKCMYVIDILQQHGNTPIMAYGHNENKTLSIVHLNGGAQSWSFGSIIDFVGAHGEEVVRDMFLTKDQTRAYSCGEDGNVRVWDLSTSSRGGAGDTTTIFKKKRRDKKAERFAPY
ncbi:putative wd repeat-containing protein [Acrodontium crateriforme]|uniref:Wd repeat-containing protein n=1 Tax=Acrodontium crateriforme TaxID=150365 RepID=A0AAQ3R817_9PEZI|nr:putative wd repeat-containing protein [Acrodontium crateriforme]